MPQITFEVKNAELVAKKLQNIRAAIPKISEDRISDLVIRISKKIKQYPPRRAGSRYVRTRTLANSVLMRRMAHGYALKVDPVSPSGTHYGRYVVGGAEGGSGVNGQAWMHVGRWLLFRDVVDYEMTKLPAVVESHIKLKIKAENLG